MRTGQAIVFGLIVATLSIASAAWCYQRTLMRRHHPMQSGVSAPLPPAPEPRFERQPAPGGVPAEPVEPKPAIAGIPSGVPVEWAEKNNAAILALEADDAERAIALFEECRAQFPEHGVFAANLAEALVRAAVREHAQNARCSLCLERLERAIALAPTRTELPPLLERWKRERGVEDEFWSESSLHFALSYDGQRSDLLWGSTRLLDQLEAAYADLGDLFGYFPVEAGRPKFRVVLYERAGFSLLTGLGDWAGGAFDGSAIRIPIADLSAEESRLKRVFRHELCHAFIREQGGDSVPGWLNEGLAQWVEQQSEGGRIQAADAAKAQLVGSAPIPLEELVGSLSGWKEEASIGRAYRQSLAFTGYLWRQHGQRAVLAMISGCKQGQTPAASFEAEVRLPLADAFEAWSGSLR